MRYQQTWNEHEPDLEMAAQKNLQDTVDKSLQLGFKHIETARLYGSSEYQLGKALAKHKREDYILQTKGTPKADIDEFRQNLEDSFRRLQTDRLDLFGVHGINLPEHLELTLKPGGCMEVLREYQAKGKIGHIGFSTHGSSETITKAIQSNEFDYVNLHYYYIHQNNWSCIQEARQRDMGVFIISPSDKGGMLYKPPAKLVELTAPFSPMVFNDLNCLSHSEIHTLSLGASKPSDFDEHCKTFSVLESGDFSEVHKVKTRLDQTLFDTCGEDFIKGWQTNLPSHEQVPGEINLEVSIRLWTLAKSFDLIDYALMRYNLMGNADHWFPGNKVDPKLLPKVEIALKGHPFLKKLM
jgi:predicted aldo/keto reductase-like oxidoreductase